MHGGIVVKVDVSLRWQPRGQMIEYHNVTKGLIEKHTLCWLELSVQCPYQRLQVLLLSYLSTIKTSSFKKVYSLKVFNCGMIIINLYLYYWWFISTLMNALVYTWATDTHLCYTNKNTNKLLHDCQATDPWKLFHYILFMN